MWKTCSNEAQDPAAPQLLPADCPQDGDSSAGESSPASLNLPACNLVKPQHLDFSCVLISLNSVCLYLLCSTTFALVGKIGVKSGFCNSAFLLSPVKVPLCHKHQLGPSSSNSCFCGCYSVSKLCPALCNPMATAHQASLSFTISLSLLKLMSVESVMPSNHLIFCRPLLFLLQSFPVSGSFPMSQLFASGGQSIGASASASVLPMNIQG